MKILLLFILWGLWHLIFSTKILISPLLPLIEQEFSLSHATAGGLFFFLTIGSCISYLLAGFLSFRIGYRQSIIICFIFTAATLMGLRYAGTYRMFAVLLFSLGFFSGIYIPCSIPMVTSIFEPKDWGKAISFNETAAGFSLLSVPFVAAFVLGFFPWRSMFVIFAGAMMVMICLFVLFSTNPSPKEEKKVLLTTILKRTDFWILAVLWVIIGMTTMGLYNIVPLFLVSERGMGIEAANRIFSMSRIGGFFAMIGIGFFIDNFSVKKILFFLILTTGVSTVGVALADTTWILVTLLILQATFSVVFSPVGLVAIAKLTTFRERSAYTGMIMFISGSMGVGLAPYLVGMAADTWSFQTGFFLLGVLTLATCLLLKILQEL